MLLDTCIVRASCGSLRGGARNAARFRSSNGSNSASRRPVLSGRAPLRRFGDRAAHQPGLVVPSSADGLHCGAVERRVHRRRCCWSSRPQRTGSIAAFAGLRCRCGPAGRPVLSGRAPLRQLHIVTAVRQPAGRPVLSGRAPLRLLVGFDRAGRSLGRPVLSGRAPLRPTALWGRGEDILCRPVLSGRAPLRRRSAAILGRFPGPVVPSSADGLHCGSGIGRDLTILEASSRPQRTGSIAACRFPALRHERGSAPPDPRWQ